MFGEPLLPDAGGVTLRKATDADLPFIDALQKANSKSLGFMTRATLEGKVRLGDVTVAEAANHKVMSSGEGAMSADRPLSSTHCSLPPQRVGYAIASDRYYKREDVGVFYQVNVVPEARRGLVGAALVRGVMAGWPYGVRLACCWCAQDLDGPSRFWEALGFVPLAYRGGSRGKARVHIFWQRHVREVEQGDGGWWYSVADVGRDAVRGPAGAAGAAGGALVGRQAGAVARRRCPRPARAAADA